MTMTSFLCHCSRVGLTPLLTVPRKHPLKNMLPSRGSYLGELFIARHVYNTFSAKIKALRLCKIVALPRQLRLVTKS